MEEPTNQSPRPNMPIGMDFPTAIKAVIEGKIITRLDWMRQGVSDYGILRNGFLILHKDDGDHKWILNDGDLLANDWVVQDLSADKVN